MAPRTPKHSTPLEPKQRQRLRRVVRYSLVSLISVEVLFAALVFAAPRVSASGVPVFDTLLTTTTGQVYGALVATNTILGQINSLLEEIRDDTEEIRQIADEQSQPLSDSWTANLAAVTTTPMESMQGISFAADAPGSALADIVPGAVPWESFHDEYIRSADTVLVTLRSSLDVLHTHNEEIENEEALNRIASLADSQESQLALGALKVQSNLEIARQLHALRSQHALETSLYAVTESHRIGAQARSIAEDEEANCNRAAGMIGGPTDALISLVLC